MARTGKVLPDYSRDLEGAERNGETCFSVWSEYSQQSTSPWGPRAPRPPAARRAAVSDSVAIAMRRAAPALVLLMGVLIAWVDTRPGWDDTGVIAVSLLIAAGASALAGVRWWVAAVLTVFPLLVAEARSVGWGLAAAPVFSLAGAVGGALLRRGAGFK